ncbi:PadR family transcriptional regulator [Agromyces silvae]|uniref:PadR family transcriptional regulator n=1 Tax=Agromyces silvae TaxID=3388266 RepID=UPI00280A5D0A|nr:PadR family transcriptional regulator [Agromyces protaetiae]
MRFLILGVLLEGALSLYDVHKRFTGGISLFYAASFGSIQRALEQLESLGWATSAAEEGSARRKRLYTVTSTGRDAWREWMLAPLTGSDPEPTMLARVYLLGSLPQVDRAGCIAELRRRIDTDAAALEDLAARLSETHVPESLDEIARYRRATLDYGIRSHALAAAWLAELAATPESLHSPKV